MPIQLLSGLSRSEPAIRFQRIAALPPEHMRWPINSTSLRFDDQVSQDTVSALVAAKAALRPARRPDEKAQAR
jgi:hypothetical protein